MEEWKEYKLEEICMKITDGSHSSPRAQEYGYPMFSVKDMLEYGFDYSKCKYISKEDFLILKQNGCVPQKGDVLVAKDGSYLKQIFVCKQTKEEGILSSIAIFRPNELVDSYFLCYLLKSPQVYNYIANNCVSGSALPRIVLKDFKSVKLQIPSKETQINIVSKLKSLDDKIECNRRINDNFAFSFLLLTSFVLWLLKLRNDNLLKQARALYKSWFVDFEPFKNGEFEDSELGIIPQGWSVKQLGEITTQVNEKVKERVDVKVLSPITTGELVLSEDYFTKQVFSESISKYIVVKPTYFAYNPARVNIGSLGMNEYDYDGCVSPVYVVFRCEDDYQYFFDLFRRTENFKEEVKARAIGGVRQSLTYKDFSLIKVVYPPIDVIRGFNQVYLRILANAKHNDVETARLASLRDTLLPKLMSGELKIS